MSPVVCELSRFCSKDEGSLERFDLKSFGILEIDAAHRSQADASARIYREFRTIPGEFELGEIQNEVALGPPASFSLLLPQPSLELGVRHRTLGLEEHAEHNFVLFGVKNLSHQEGERRTLLAAVFSDEESSSGRDADAMFTVSSGRRCFGVLCGEDRGNVEPSVVGKSSRGCKAESWSVVVRADISKGSQCALRGTVFEGYCDRARVWILENSGATDETFSSSGRH